MITTNPRVLDQMRDLMRAYPAAIRQAEVLAVNEAARYGKAEGARQITKEIAFQKRYVSDNLFISGKASSGKPEATITGRFRPTSLANSGFRRSPVKFGGGQKGVKVQVAADGATKLIPKAFFVRLRAGKTLDTDTFNVGLAIRLPHGKQPDSKGAQLLRKDKHGDLYLLYGPSVNQAFYFVRDRITPAVQNRLSNEFVRQMERLTRGR